jgi:branched-chain amino acid transport system ATP-binding protein
VTALLELSDVEARYGQLKALHGVSLAVNEGEVAAVLGANGAGKTTTLRSISGTVRRAGEIVFDGRRIDKLSPEDVARLGVAHVPEGRGTFMELSVWENLRLGAYTRRNGKVFKADVERIVKLFPRLAERRDQQAGTLSGGEQQMLALGRALIMHPRVLLLDEPSLGLAPLVVREIFRILGELNEQDGLTVLVVEQNANRALASTHRAFVLETGRVVVEGETAELREHPTVRKSYLGY